MIRFVFQKVNVLAEQRINTGNGEQLGAGAVIQVRNYNGVSPGSDSEERKEDTTEYTYLRYIVSKM